MSARAFNNLLIILGVQSRSETNGLILNSEYEGRGYAVTRTYTYTKTGKRHTRLYWTQEGRQFFRQFLPEKGCALLSNKEAVKC